MIKPSEFAELQKLCQRSFPDRLDQRISQIESLAGERHSMLSLTLSWREGRRPRVERLIVRRYADPWTWWSLDDHEKAQREWVVMRWLYGEGLPVPRLYASGTENDHGFLLMARAPGQKCVTSGRHVGELAALLARIHRSTPPVTVRKALPGVVVSEELCRLGDIARQCDDGGLIEAISELLAQEVEVLPPCVLHGDLQREADVLCDARGVTALLNWENSALGDPRWDVARVSNWLRTHQAAGLVDRFCAAYQDRVEKPVADMAFWEALAAVQQWAAAAWVRENAPPERTEAWSSKLEAWRGQAWRALTRSRYEKVGQTVPQEHSV